MIKSPNNVKVARPKSSLYIYFLNGKYIYLILKNIGMHKNKKKKILPLLKWVFSHM